MGKVSLKPYEYDRNYNNFEGARKIFAFGILRPRLYDRYVLKYIWCYLGLFVTTGYCIGFRLKNGYTYSRGFIG